MERDTSERVRRLTEEYGSWFLRDDRLAQGRMSGELHPFEHLFLSLPINGVTLKNRIVMAPMGNISVADETGRPSDRMVRHFAERARGGAGLLTSGLIPIGQKSDPTATEPGGLSYFPRLDRSRSVFAGWRDIAAAGQAAAVAKAMQIDGVCLHGHEGYLLDQLTSPAFNRRRFGRYADWQRFDVELVGEIRRRTGSATRSCTASISPRPSTRPTVSA
jgi:2,4-dienoyl-CoA reductase-like NADH-dependent reductase (Old Yellow Enzyme family)